MRDLLRRMRTVLWFALITSAAYLAVNRYPLGIPAQLPATALDRAMPFIIWTVWPYLFVLVACLVVPLLVRNAATFQRLSAAYALAMGANLAIWLLLPTAITRPEPPHVGGVSAMAYRLLVAIDAPRNCLPSGHITIPAVVLWALVSERPRWRIPAWLALAALSLSLLTTKQHYVVDLFAGFGTALAAIALTGRFAGKGRRDA